jgi:methionyl-tRNA formyltransferase
MDLNTVFLGSGEFSRDLLVNLYRAGFDIGGVITRPDRPAGRGLKPRPTPVKEACKSNGLEVFQPSGPGDPAFIAILDELKPELMLVADYGYILPRPILEYTPKGCLNVHPSLLPRYRGADPIRRALMDGVKTTGVTLMLLDEGMDTGPIIARRELEVEDTDNAGTVREKLASLGADMLVATIPPYVFGKITPEQQDEEAATYANPVQKSELIIDWSRSANEIYNRVRAFSPRPGAYTCLRGKRVKILRAHPIERRQLLEAAYLHITEKGALVAGTGYGALEIEEVQPEGKRAMSSGDFLRGYDISQGEFFESG